MIVLYILLAMVFGYTIFTLFDVSTSDPGYIQKGNVTKEQHDAEDPKVTVALHTTIPLKYCYTCKITRPHRSFHCDTCGNCVSKHGNTFILIY